MSQPAEFFIKRCFQLAKKGINHVAPNPMVGSVVTIPDSHAPYGQRIIGEGYHQKFGGPHAEVNALASVENKELLNKATVYVSLEPCSHFGKTPPCADLLVQSGIKRVIVAMEDPNPEVSGRGVARLRAAGIDVIVNVLQTEALELNRRFVTAHTKKRPYVILKWAETPLGYLNGPNKEAVWISNRRSQQIVHQWRSEEQAIMVGVNTAIIDDPSLTTRSWAGKSPLRVLLDSSLRTPPHYGLLKDGDSTLVFNKEKQQNDGAVEFIATDPKNLTSVLSNLLQHKVNSLIVEGGSAVLQSFIDQNLWDEARVIMGDMETGAGTKAPKFRFLPTHSETIGNDTIRYIKNPQQSI